MHINKIVLYLLIFISAASFGYILNKDASYECDFESVIADNPIKDEANAEPYIKAELPDDGLININTATAHELTALKWVGEKISQRIVEYRETHGSFEKIEDIMNVPGIGEKKFKDMKEHITVE